MNKLHWRSFADGSQPSSNTEVIHKLFHQWHSLGTDQREEMIAGALYYSLEELIKNQNSF